MTDSVRDRLLIIIGRIKNRSPDKIDTSSSLESLGIDSLDVVETLMDIEEEFDIYLPMDDDLSGTDTLEGLLLILEGLIAGAKKRG